MNIKKIIAILSLQLVLAGCAAETVPRVNTAPVEPNAVTGTQATVTNEVSLAETAAYKYAVDQKNTALCDKIVDSKLKEDCKVTIETSQKSEAALSADLKNRDEIVTNGKLADCKTLTEENNRTDCELNILSNQAIKAADASVCDKGSTDAIKKTCRDMVSSSIEEAKLGTQSAV